MYTDKLHRSIFNVGCPKFHKYAHKLVTRPIRLAYINELDESKLDEEILKDFSDDSSRLSVEEMYGTMCENQRIQCKLITTSNKDPNLKLDGGLMSRIKIQKYESRFVPECDVDKSKHWYLVDPTWVTSRFSQDAYKLAFFHFLLSKGNVYQATMNFTLTFDLSDFESLYWTSMKSFYNDPRQSDRFETKSDEMLPTSDEGWMMYWTGPDALTALVCEKILCAAGYKVYRLWDMCPNPDCQWCILTKYKTKDWMLRENK